MTCTTVVIVLVGGLVVWIFDSREFSDYGSALWYTLQTATTVGYGDKVPTSLDGRLTGSFVMIVAVALLASVTALINRPSWTPRSGAATRRSRIRPGRSTRGSMRSHLA